MLSLMDKQEIIISHFLEGKSQLEIHRQTGFARKTGMSKQQKKKIDIHECLTEEGFKYRFCNVRRGNEKGHVGAT